MKIGTAVSFRWLQRFDDNQSLSDYLRWRTYVLGPVFRPPTKLPPLKALKKQPVFKAVAPSRDPDVLAREIGRLPAGQMLVQSGDFTVPIHPLNPYVDTPPICLNTTFDYSSIDADFMENGPA